MPKNSFPKDFLWGASTSSHQIEGSTYNQWTMWEATNAHAMAKTAKKRLGYLPNWSKIKDQAEDPNNYISGRGVEHYTRYPEDFKIAKKLNLNAFRFSIEWSRLEPLEGHWDEAEWEHYRQYIKDLRKAGLQPMLNLWHWTMPTWLAAKGGFSRKQNLKYFDRFVEKVAEELLVGVEYVVTINEPNVYASFAYLTGEHVPHERNVAKFARSYWYLAQAHRRAYYILKLKKPSLQVGLASQLANIQAKRPHNLLDSAITHAMRYGWNWWFIRRTELEQDFIGVNYYFTDYYRFEKGVQKIDPNVPLSDLGWYMEPEGLYPILLRIWAHYRKPIIITENGLADAGVHYRRWWLQESMIAMERAMSEGVDIRGYFHWSLVDNFEWSFGWWPKFGLVEVDRETMKRTIRPSALWWAKEIKRYQTGKWPEKIE